MNKATFLFLLFLFIACQNDQHTDKVGQNQGAPIFELVASTQSGITFNNKIIPNIATKENLFDFDYFYNGAGVAVGDINNDGLSDIFFSGNQAENRLYLNKGNLQFEDITDKAGINAHKQWSNGVTMVDINQDGWLDIYVSQGGPFEAEQRKNLLFINQGLSHSSKGGVTFKESAENYGLADKGISTQSVFFDFDKDGDLDCLVMNENALYGLDPLTLFSVLEQRPEQLHKSSSHLYENVGGLFADITRQAGLLRPSFGLGLVVSDINGDNWPDIYMANDYFIPDALYINQKNGTFTEQIKNQTNQVSFYGMGADIADINNDGLQDIFVLDMASADHYRAKTLMASMNVENFSLLVDRLKFQYQYMFNSLQLNQGNNHFTNIAQMAGVAKTDWSWAGLIADLDNNEHKEIFVTNGYRKYGLDNDLQIKVRQAQQQYEGKVPLEVKKNLYDAMPTEKLSNILYRPVSELHFEDVAAEWGMPEKSYSNGAVLADLDEDGDLDVVINNIDEEAFLYKNLSRENKWGNYLRVKTLGKLSESFAKVTILYDNKTQVFESKRVRGYMSAMENIAHFGMGGFKKIDTVRVEWLSGKIEERVNVKVNQLLEFREENAALVQSKQIENENILFTPVSIGDLSLYYRHQENSYNDFSKEILLPHKQSTYGPCISGGDVNGDGKEDLYFGGAVGQAGRLFIQEGNAYRRLEIPAFESDRAFEDMEAAFFDVDSDGDNDLYIVSGGNTFSANSENYRDRLYLNDGDGNFIPGNERIEKRYAYSGKSVAVIDFDRDGDADLLVGNRINGQDYPRSAPSILYENENGRLVDVTEEIVPQLTDFGIINKVIPTDFNNDGWLDFVAVGEWTHIGLFENQEGTFEDISAASGLDDEKGWWFTVAVKDINNDGRQDFVVGNVGLNTKYKASYDHPLKIFANDFDRNGTLDIVLSKEYQGEYVPFRGRECSSQQMPFIVEKFPTYDEFAKASIEDVYGEELDQALQLEATEFRSLLLINKGDGKFKKVILPEAAQAFPIMSCINYDLNKDGFEDIILAGNIYNTEVETPRQDGGSGLVLLSDKSNGYQAPLTVRQTGLYISGNVKALKVVKSGQSSYLVAGRNNDLLSLFQINDEWRSLNR